MPSGSPVLAAAPHRIGKVTLTVHDSDRVSRFYEDVIGLRTLERDGSSVRLGVDDTIFLELRRDVDARRRSPSETGLFHTAFLLPSRRDLGAWLGFVAARRMAVEGASDHGVSEAVYLADPEGNGIEVYADRPADRWPMSAGRLAMTTDPLDIPGLLDAGRGLPWTGVPGGSTVGHLHLQVASLTEADRFWTDLLGFEVMARYPGASFYGSGGYHHQLGANIWNSRGAPRRDGAVTGLTAFELIVKDDRVLDTAAARLGAAGTPFTAGPGRLEVTDPCGTVVVLAKA
jgi:catechol 2,3-dioxygenase